MISIRDFLLKYVAPGAQQDELMGALGEEERAYSEWACRVVELGGKILSCGATAEEEEEYGVLRAQRARDLESDVLLKALAVYMKGVEAELEQMCCEVYVKTEVDKEVFMKKVHEKYKGLMSDWRPVVEQRVNEVFTVSEGEDEEAGGTSEKEEQSD